MPVTTRTTAGTAAGARPEGVSTRLRFGVFAECLLTGVWIVIAALPLVTLPAALAAGTAHLRRHLAHERSAWRDFATDVTAAVRHGGWLTGLAGWAAYGLLTVDLAAVRAGLPGGPYAAAVGVLALLGLVVAGLRAAAVWRPGDSWRALLRDAAGRTVRDPGGSMLLLGGLAVVAVSAWQLPPLVAPALGCLAASAVAAERRR